MRQSSFFRKIAFSVLALPSFILPLNANEVEATPAVSSSPVSSSEEAFMPSQKLFHKFIKIVAEPQKLVKDVDQQSVQVVGLEDDKVDLQWIWREKVDLNAPDDTKTKEGPVPEKSDEVIVQDLGNGLVVTSRPITEEDIDGFFPHKRKGILKVRETKELSILEAQWLVGAFKDNARYPDAPVLHRLFSDILEGKVSTKRKIESSVDEDTSESEPESYFEHEGLEILMEILEGSVCSLASQNRLQLMCIENRGIIFGIRWGTGNSAGFDIRNHDQAYWLFDLLSLHPAFPDASTFRTLVKVYQEGIKN